MSGQPEPKRWHPELGGGPMPDAPDPDDFARAILGPNLDDPGYWYRQMRLKVR